MWSWAALKLHTKHCQIFKAGKSLASAKLDFGALLGQSLRLHQLETQRIQQAVCSVRVVRLVALDTPQRQAPQDVGNKAWGLGESDDYR